MGFVCLMGQLAYLAFPHSLVFVVAISHGFVWGETKKEWGTSLLSLFSIVYCLPPNNLEGGVCFGLVWFTITLHYHGSFLLLLLLLLNLFSFIFLCVVV